MGMKFKLFKKKASLSEGQDIIALIAETADEHCIKITQTLISLSYLRAVEHLPEERREHPYRL